MSGYGNRLCWGLTTRQPLWVILCRLPEKERKEIEEIVEEMKERHSSNGGSMRLEFFLIFHENTLWLLIRSAFRWHF